MAKRLTKNLIVSILILAVTLVVVSPVAGYVASLRAGQVAYAASALAAFVVWVAGSLSLFVTMRATIDQGKGSRSPKDGGLAGITGLLMAMLLRIGLPLVAVVLLTKLGALAKLDTLAKLNSQAVEATPLGWLALLGKSGFYGLVVVHYLVALLVETVLSVRWLARQEGLSRQPYRSLQDRSLQDQALGERVGAKTGSF